MSLILSSSGELYATPDDATTRILRDRPELAALVHQANECVRHLKLDEAVQVFDDAHIEPPREWLLEKANDAWNGRSYFAGHQQRAIRLFARAGEVARLNKIGEYLALDGPGESVFDAFHGAGNTGRIREVSEQYLREGFDEGLYGFDLLQEAPPRELLEVFARALVTRAGWPYRMLEVAKAAGITLPRAFVLEAAGRYRRTIGDCTAALLEITDHEPPKDDEGGM
jgi:hypothetical protein